MDSEFEWLLHTLWDKNTKSSPEFLFTVPDTLILRENESPHWYFTNKDMQLQRKEEVTPRQISHAFLSGTDAGCRLQSY